MVRLSSCSSEPPPSHSRKNQQGHGSTAEPRNEAARPPLQIRIPEHAAVTDLGIGMPDPRNQFDQFSKHFDARIRGGSVGDVNNCLQISNPTGLLDQPKQVVTGHNMADGFGIRAGGMVT
jgi:hypothetical protein